MWNIVQIIISFIGCITGTLSLIILFKQKCFNEGKLLIGEDRLAGHSFYFRPSEKIGGLQYKTNYSAALSIKVTNKSSYQITIDSAEISAPKNPFYHDNNFEIYLLSYETGYDKSIIFPVQKVTKLPLKLDPFETKYIGLRFPFFDFAVVNYGLPVNINLKINTSRKPAFLTMKVPEFLSFAKAQNQRNQTTKNANN